MPTSSNADTTQQMEADANGDSTLKAAKDRNCPFCKVAFTSSSLGRHLDLYIREKNPKPPDGIHDVEQIRSMRRGITRRHARTSKAQSSPHGQSSTTTTGEIDHSTIEHATTSNGVASHGIPDPRSSQTLEQQQQQHLPATTVREPTRDPIKTYLNKPSWQITGVINDLPPRANPYMRDGIGSAPTPSSTTNTPASAPLPPPHQQLNFDFSTKQKLAEACEARQAAEHALREVLDGVRAAHARLHREPLWDFDFFAQTYPALCLRLLEPPPLLFSTAPTPGFPKTGTWPLSPPKDLPNGWLVGAVGKRFRAKGRAIAAYEPDGIYTDEHVPPEAELSPEIRRHNAHVLAMEIKWVGTPEPRKQELWQLELMRYAAEQRQKALDTTQQLEAAHAETSRLRFEAESLRAMLSSTNPYAQPSPPAPVFPAASSQQAVTPDTIRTLAPDALADWDFQRLTHKWTGLVRAQKRQAASVAGAYGSASNDRQGGHSVVVGGGGEAVTITGGSLQSYAFSRLGTSTGPGVRYANVNGYDGVEEDEREGEDDEGEDGEDEDAGEDGEGSDVDMADEDEREPD